MALFLFLGSLASLRHEWVQFRAAMYRSGYRYWLPRVYVCDCWNWLQVLSALLTIATISLVSLFYGRPTAELLSR